MTLKVAIFDYGAGNIFSLKNSLEKNGAQVDIITGLNKSKEYSGLLLPGVGNFDPAIRSIRDYSSTDFKDYVGESMPVLGICLGMEMFFEKSEEGKEQGLRRYQWRSCSSTKHNESSTHGLEQFGY